MSPQELAQEFCKLSNEDYVDFFNEVGEIMYKSDSTTFKYKMLNVLKRNNITLNGQLVIQSIGQHYISDSISKPSFDEELAYTEWMERLNGNRFYTRI